MEPVQHPIIRQTAIPEAIGQLVIVGVVVSACMFFELGFEISILVLLVLGFALNTLNVIASATSSNVHLAEIRDQLIEINKSISRRSDDN